MPETLCIKAPHNSSHHNILLYTKYNQVLLLYTLGIQFPLLETIYYMDGKYSCMLYSKQHSVVTKQA